MEELYAMLIILHPDIDKYSPEITWLMDYLRKLPGIDIKQHEIDGEQQRLTEIYLIGNTKPLDAAQIEGLAVVDRVVRISSSYRVWDAIATPSVSPDSLITVSNSARTASMSSPVYACHNTQHVETMLQTLQQNGQQCTRMGAYKPLTNPYSFQGHGSSCLPWVFELAGKYGIRVVAMEAAESHILTK